MVVCDLHELYFDWLTKLVLVDDRVRDDYSMLLRTLHQREFTFTIQLDENRLADGIDLRYRFCYENHISQEGADILSQSGPCSILEMMAALILKCEESILGEPEYGSYNHDWFMEMLNNLKIGNMSNDNFDEQWINYRLDILLDRNYEPNGEGGLFTIPNAKVDLRDVEIWYQMNWYLSYIVLKGE